LLQGLDEEEYIGRAAARDGGHSVHLAFVVDPDRAADGAQDAVSRIALGRADFR